MQPNLCAEFDAAELNLLGDIPLHRAIEKVGVDSAVWPMIGYTPIWIEAGSSRYVPDALGSPAYITPVVELDGLYGPLQEAEAHVGRTVDLVAWHPAHPERWALRTGEGRYLGYVAWRQAQKPTRIWRSPLRWLRERCDGLVLLTDDPAERHTILMQLRAGIIAEDRRHAAELRAICERPYPVPRITVT